MTDFSDSDRVGEVPLASHYDAAYLGEDAIRLSSYRMQLVAALEVRPVNALIIGRGDGLVPELLRASGVAADTLDIQPHLKPDICASVLQMPFTDASFDVVLCCQVLEHLPFERFGDAIAEIARVARKRIVISLPDQRRHLALEFRFGRRSWRLGVSLPRSRQPIPQWRRDRMGHYWEIGFEPVGFADVANSLLAAGLNYKSQRNPDYPWHTFFIATPLTVVLTNKASRGAHTLNRKS